MVSLHVESVAQLLVVVAVLLKKAPALDEDLLCFGEVDEEAAAFVGPFVVAAELGSSHEAEARWVRAHLAGVALEQRRVVAGLRVHRSLHAFVLAHEVQEDSARGCKYLRGCMRTF